ncbi:MAG: zinc dependent phospholipase C family protein [Enterocloster asparagiformis]|nr:zinc dependent phospholipase C family protein [Enterocloster asparagiformis]
MPGFTTHYILGMKAYNDMPQTSLKFIIAKYRWLYQLGLQGPDIFFYNLPVLRHRDHRNVGSHMHEHLVNEFFRCCFENLTNIESRQQREEGLAYVCGFLCHYVGDSICHPYVYGRIEYDVHHPGGYYHGLHAQLENDIDALLLHKYKKKKPSQFNQAATICLNGMEIQFISRFLSKCINETYYPLSYRNNYQVTARMIHRSILAIRFGCRTLADPHGKKKNKIEFVENIFLKNPVASNKLVTDTVADPAWSLNLHHETWCNPWNKQIASQASFPDLFKQSLSKLDTIYYMINSMVDGTPSVDPVSLGRLLSEIGNYSYHSGLPCAE